MPTGVYQRTDEHRKKISLGLMGKTSGMRGKQHSEESKRRTSQSESGDKHYNWKGGKIRHNGYVLRWKPEHKFADSHGYVKEHRLVYEESRNCCLLPWIHIHHIDGNGFNNVWYNLIPMTQIDHGRLSARARWG